MILESEFGTLPGFTPTLDTVIDFMTTVRSAINTWFHASFNLYTYVGRSMCTFN